MISKVRSDCGTWQINSQDPYDVITPSEAEFQPSFSRPLASHVNSHTSRFSLQLMWLWD